MTIAIPTIVVRTVPAFVMMDAYELDVKRYHVNMSVFLFVMTAS